MSFIKNSLWLLPFCFYIIGYFLPLWLWQNSTILTPNVVGESIHKATLILSEHNLYPYIIKEQEEEGLPHGTIVQQTPAPQQKIKERQCIYLTLSTKPSARLVPDCLNKYKDSLQADLQKNEIPFECYYIENSYPTDICFAQSPAPGCPVSLRKPLILYCAYPGHKPRLWPNMCGQPLNIVLDFLNNYDITPHIMYQSSPESPNGIIIQQRPLAGSFVDSDTLSNLAVQLLVQ